MLYYSMSFVSLDVDVVDVDVVDAGSLGHCCCNVFDDLVNGGVDESSSLENYTFKDYTKVVTQKAKGWGEVEACMTSASLTRTRGLAVVVNFIALQ